MQKRNFDKILLEAVDEGSSALGESSKQAIYFHLENGFNVKKREIPGKIEDFAYGIEKIFGLGASFLEILIVKRIHEEVGLTVQLPQSGDFAFLEYAAAAKQSFGKRGGKKKTKGLKKNG